jgi:uncharacterized protein YfdQ (DUF2303 family)
MSTPDPTAELVSVADTSGVAAALDAAEKHAQTLLTDVDGTVLVVAHRNDRQIDQIDLERYEAEPVRSRGTVKALSADGFIDSYRHRTVEDARFGAVIYANPDNCALVAVLDDDYGSHPGWRKHRIELALQTTPEWQHWTGHQGLGTQRRFAEVIEAGQDEIVGQPNATLMLEIAQEFTASIGGKFVQKGRLANGTVQLAYEETVDAKVGEGLVPVPPSFTVRLRPFYGAEPRDLEARVRYTCRAGELQIGYSLHRPDEVKREAFAVDVLGHVREQLPDATVIEGVPAEPTPAGR